MIPDKAAIGEPRVFEATRGPTFLATVVEIVACRVTFAFDDT